MRDLINGVAVALCIAAVAVLLIAGQLPEPYPMASPSAGAGKPASLRKPPPVVPADEVRSSVSVSTAEPVPSVASVSAPPPPTMTAAETSSGDNQLMKDMLTRMVEEQNQNRLTIGEMQATIAQLKEDLAKQNQSMEVPAKNDGEVLILGDGLFESGRFLPTAKLRDAVAKLLPTINAHTDEGLVVEGHSDSSPITVVSGKGAADNMALTMLRARTVATLLEELGVAKDRITIRAYGDTRPIASNGTEQGRRRNRRVEFHFVPMSAQR